VKPRPIPNNRCCDEGSPKAHPTEKGAIAITCILVDQLTRPDNLIRLHADFDTIRARRDHRRAHRVVVPNQHVSQFDAPLQP
jgi:hypothetical protein